MKPILVLLFCALVFAPGYTIGAFLLLYHLWYLWLIPLGVMLVFFGLFWLEAEPNTPDPRRID